jgi:hypothetical protein
MLVTMSWCKTGLALGKVDEEELVELGSPVSLGCAEEDSYEIP